MDLLILFIVVIKILKEALQYNGTESNPGNQQVHNISRIISQYWGLISYHSLFFSFFSINLRQMAALPNLNTLSILSRNM